MSSLHVTIAQNASGKMVDIADVPSGLSCNCVCACCGESLVARKGEVKQWHFAHKSGAECAGALETALHKAAKQVLLEHRLIMVPGEVLSTQRSSSWMRDLNLYVEETYKIDDLAKAMRPELYQKYQAAMKLNAPELKLKLTHVEDEVRDETTGRIPDISCNIDVELFTERYNHLPTDAFQEGLIIEIAVRHKCDAEKIADLKRLGRPALEVDMKDLVRDGDISLGKIRRLLEETSHDRQWLVMPEYLARAYLIRDTYIEESGELYLEEMNYQYRLRAEEERRQRENKERTFWAAVVEAKRPGSSAVRFKVNSSASGMIFPYDVGYAISLDFVEDILLFDRMRTLFDAMGWFRERFGKKYAYLSYQSLDKLLLYLEQQCQLQGYNIEFQQKSADKQSIPREKIVAFEPMPYEPGVDLEEG
jgi:hypothetical protein